MLKLVMGGKEGVRLWGFRTVAMTTTMSMLLGLAACIRGSER
jgi:hypothetical protein